MEGGRDGEKGEEGWEKALHSLHDLSQLITVSGLHQTVESTSELNWWSACVCVCVSAPNDEFFQTAHEMFSKKDRDFNSKSIIKPKCYGIL